MKVGDLKKGMVLRVSDPDRLAWLTDQNPLSTGEVEMRFIHSFMKDLVPGRAIPREELIVYLGHDRESVHVGNAYCKSLIRRVMVTNKTAVITGYNIKHLESHPDFPC